MPYSADTMDSRVRGYGYVDRGDVDRVMRAESVNARSVYGVWRSWLDAFKEG